MVKILKNLFKKQSDGLEEFRGKRMSLEHGEYIKLLVKKAGERDKNREVFGAGKHQYKLNPVVTMEEINSFESKHNIKLPEEYVFFLTMVGNGGAGPYYGIYSLDKIKMTREYPDAISKKAFIDKHLTKDSWKEMMDKLEEAENDEEYDELMEQVYAGMIIIGTQGCTYDNLLMINGSEEGKLVYIDWNLEPEYGPYFTDMTFLEWYENYFKEIASGNKVDSYGYIKLGKEEELISEYQKVVLENKSDILRSFFRFNEVSDDTIEFLKCRDYKTLDSLRVELLYRFNVKAAMEIFNSLIKGDNLEGAILCARRIPDELKDDYYSDMVKLLYNDDLKEKDKILFFLTDCKSLLGKDLITFAMNEKNEEEKRKTAIWAISKAPDKIDYLDEFISWMRGDSYWIAHTALQGMAEVKNEKLLETYKWMWKKYGSDSIMVSNLDGAFRKNGYDIKNRRQIL